RARAAGAPGVAVVDRLGAGGRGPSPRRHAVPPPRDARPGPAPSRGPARARPRPQSLPDLVGRLLRRPRGRHVRLDPDPRGPGLRPPGAGPAGREKTRIANLTSTTFAR